jgi:hypothetical protein
MLSSNPLKKMQKSSPKKLLGETFVYSNKSKKLLCDFSPLLHDFFATFSAGSKAASNFAFFIPKLFF